MLQARAALRAPLVAARSATAARSGARSMHGTPEEIKASMDRWFKSAFGGGSTSLRARAPPRARWRAVPHPLPVPHPYSSSRAPHQLAAASVASIVLVLTPFTAYTIWAEANHKHAEEGPTYSHMKIMHKRWPWAANCALFDIHCRQHWAESHSGKAAAH